MAENVDYDLLKKLTFKTTLFRKNFDMLSKNDNFITECEGEITKVRFDENKPPILVGEFGFTVWNFSIAKSFEIDLIKNMIENIGEDSYSELYPLIKNNKINIKNVDKLIVIHNVIIKEEFKKKGVTQEFVEFLFRDFYFGKDNVVMVALVKPLQKNKINFDYYIKEKTLRFKELFEDERESSIIAFKYYSIDKLINKKDNEINHYKLFNLATKCGFSRIDDTNMFIFNPEKIIDNINHKLDKQFDCLLEI
jgi:hypothetical protein